MGTNVTAFLPCRKGSERVPNKNIRPFGSYSHGLLEIKLSQLLSCSTINSIVLSTNDGEIIKYAEALKEPRLAIHRRSENLATSKTSTDDLVRHASDLITSGHILWTHVTSPFVDAFLYKDIIEVYFESMANGHDSLMTTTPLQGFFWNGEGPINYDRNAEKWPRTQTLPLLHEINSAAFLASVEIYEKNSDRIGASPFLYQLDKFTGHDIDWEEDFILAEQLLALDIKSI